MACVAGRLIDAHGVAIGVDVDTTGRNADVDTARRRARDGERHFRGVSPRGAHRAGVRPADYAVVGHAIQEDGVIPGGNCNGECPTHPDRPGRARLTVEVVVVVILGIDAHGVAVRSDWRTRGSGRDM